MENAVKGLQIASGVLIALMILGFIVYQYNSVSELKQIQLEVLREQQAVDFNKSFETFHKRLYGTELIALSNKVDDYNKRYKTADGYKKVTLTVTGIPVELNDYIDATKTLAELHKKIEDEMTTERKKILRLVCRSTNIYDISYYRKGSHSCQNDLCSTI